MGGDKNLPAMVQVSDLETLLELIAKKNPEALWASPTYKMAFFRLGAAIAAARDEENAQEIEKKKYPQSAVGMPDDYQPHQMFNFRLKYKPEQRIPAIKMVREIFGYSLYEAKKCIDDPNTVFHIPSHTTKNLMAVAGQTGITVVACN